MWRATRGEVRAEAVHSTQEDPIGLVGGLNLYEFGSGDPVNNADPFGLMPEDAQAVVIVVGDRAKAAVDAARRRDPLFDAFFRELDAAPELYVFFEKSEQRCAFCGEGTGFSWGGAGADEFQVPDGVAHMVPGATITGAAWFDAAAAAQCEGGPDRVIAHELRHLLGLKRTGRKFHHVRDRDEFFHWPAGCRSASRP